MNLAANVASGKRTILMAALALTVGLASAQESRWEPQIQKFEQGDRETSPPLNGIVFTGSSSARGWDVERFFPDLPVINRGFGGSQTTDVIEFFDRILVPYQPKSIVFYSGDNDISGGKTTETVIADVKQFAAMVHEKLPETHIYFIPPKASISRWKLWPQMKEVGAAQEEMARTNPRIHFIDTNTPLLGENGEPDPKFFRADGLHLSEEGYILWSDLLRPMLKARHNVPASDDAVTTSP